MNQEHYEKVRRALSRSEAVMAAHAEKLELREAILRAAERCELVWAEEFPKDVWDGDTLRLDLSSADFSGGLFAGHGQRSHPLDRANLHGAKLDRTRWVFSYLNYADLTCASLRECQMMLLRCAGTIFKEADLTGASIDILLTDKESPVDFTDANLSGAKIKLQYEPAFILTGASMNGCRVSTRYGPDKKTLDAFYALLSEEQRDQMNEPKKSAAGNSGGCFIATAAWGTDQAEDVVRLRAYRDNVLRQSRVGRAFITAYEASSPPIAQMISHSPFARSLVRSLVVRPVRYLADYSLSRSPSSAGERNANY